MENKARVAPLGNGEYQIIWPEPFKFDMNFFLLAGTHKIRVLLQDGSEDIVTGVEGERETLLDWLRSLEMIDDANMKEYEEAMTE
jgi:hypothetical protein